MGRSAVRGISPLVPLQYASRRGWAVLPMHDKTFYTRDGVRIATRDPNIIKQWGWAESFGMRHTELLGSFEAAVDSASITRFSRV